MKIPGIKCEYKKVCDYLYWCGADNPPPVSCNAKNKIKSEIQEFIKKVNNIAIALRENNTMVLKSDNINFDKVNENNRNWALFAYCINEIKKKLITGEFYFDLKKFENDFSNNYVSDKAKEKILEIYLFADSPEVKNIRSGFLWVAGHIQTNIQVVQYYGNGKYVGTMDLINNKKYGYGTYTWKNGDKYVGDWHNDKRTGNGTYNWKNGDKYVGDFKNGKMHGWGDYYYNSGNLKHYSGNWRNDIRCGKGVLFYKNGGKYEGTFKNNNRHGYGEMLFSSGASYSGIWENDYMSVLGRYNYASGECYIGAFRNDKFDGFGVKYDTDGSCIFGYFKDDEPTERSCFLSPFSTDPYLEQSNLKYRKHRNGQYFGEFRTGYCEYGIYMWDSGEIYLGNYYDGERSGHGVYLYDNHDYYMGQWEDGDKHGNGYYYYNDGTCERAQWRNDAAYSSIKEYDIDDSLIQ